MSNLQRIIYLSASDYDDLINSANTPKSITKNGRTIVYNENDLYITPADNSTATVDQNYSTANYSYPILLCGTDGVGSTSDRGAGTTKLNNAFYANPSSGILYTSSLVVGGGLKITYDSTNEVVNFTFV